MLHTTDDSGNRKGFFSFSRLAQNMFPNFASDHGPYSVSKQLDILFDFQAPLTVPQYITPAALYLSECAQNEKTAAIIHNKLLKLGILKSEAPWVDTQKIDRNLPNKLSELPVYAQKTLVNLLFDWEEEIRRWKMLEEEETEIRLLMGEVKAVQGKVGHLEKRVLEIGGLKKLKPSLRAATSTGEVPHAKDLPRYEDTLSQPARGGLGTTQGSSSTA
jgi:hypothetical protein